MEEACAQCGQRGESLRRCTGCWNVRYCSRDCQKRHWSRHKVTCAKRPSTSGQDKTDKARIKKNKSSSGQQAPTARAEKDGKDGPSSCANEDSSASLITCKTCQTKTSTVVKCGRCKDVTYCSRDCRRADWIVHMVTCTPANPAAETHEETQQTETSEDQDEDTKPEHEDHSPEATGERQAGDAVSQPELAEEGDEGVKTCQRCKTKGKNMKRCGRCLDVTYCSRDCQTADWSSHKVTCEPIEVLTTDGYRETERREKAAARERSQAQHHLLAHLLMNHLGVHSITWQEARSRAALMFPFRKIVDDFDDLDSDFMGSPFRMHPLWRVLGGGMKVVALGRLTSPYYHPFRPARGVEDINGSSYYVIFYNEEPFFQYTRLREGSFICIQGAFLHMFADGSVGFRIEDPSDVRILD